MKCTYTKPDYTVQFTCWECGKALVAAFFDDVDNPDYVFCKCGRVYVVVKPFVGDVHGMADYADNVGDK